MSISKLAPIGVFSGILFMDRIKRFSGKRKSKYQ